MWSEGLRGATLPLERHRSRRSAHHMRHKNRIYCLTGILASSNPQKEQQSNLVEPKSIKTIDTGPGLLQS
eukprot:3944092-Amphidinium_carterae.3